MMPPFRRRALREVTRGEYRPWNLDNDEPNDEPKF